MKIYIVCDLEGTAGVVDARLQCSFDLEKEWFGPYYAQARRLATLELNAAVQGALDGGATEVWAWDGHCEFPGGLDVELVHPECRLVMAAGDGGPVGLESGFDAMMMIGLHGMYGAEGGRLAHSFFGGIHGVWVNGERWGEIAANAWEAGQNDVPVVFLSGDRAACTEIEGLIPGVATTCVKEGMTPVSLHAGQAPTLSLTPRRARERIREGARAAMRLTGEVSPFRVEPPYETRTLFAEKGQADWMMENRDGLTRIDEKTVGRTSDHLELIL
ncbi:M55 family metallopeptidase [Candidatus Bipolaricaulota bacterium]